MSSLPDPLEHFEEKRVAYYVKAAASSGEVSRAAVGGDSNVLHEVGYGVLVSHNFNAGQWEDNESSGNSTNIALLVSAPMGGSAAGVACFADLLNENSQSPRAQLKVICACRPGLGATSACETSTSSTEQLRTIVDDIECVLEQEGVARFHVLGMCMGAMAVPFIVHRFASSTPRRTCPQLQLPLFFNAPFTSVENPHTLRVARLGASGSVPSFVVSAGVHLAANLAGLGISSMRSSGSMQSMMDLSPHDKEAFTEEDLKRSETFFKSLTAGMTAAGTEVEMRLALAGKEVGLADAMKQMMGELAELKRSVSTAAKEDAEQHLTSTCASSPPRKDDAEHACPLIKIYCGGEKLDRMVSPAAVSWFEQILRDAAAEVGCDPKLAVRAQQFKEAAHGGMLWGQGPIQNPVVYRDVLEASGF